MKDSYRQAVARIDRLIAMCGDRAMALRAAADAIDDGERTQCLLARARQWANLGDDLQLAIHDPGGAPRNASSTRGALHRTWIYIKAAANEAEAIRAECLRREAGAAHDLQQACGEGLPPRVGAILGHFLGELAGQEERFRDTLGAGVARSRSGFGRES